ncbi:class I SAM-dependent methyltransferase [Deltaproteobacteria bacterium]|nr:class I SAM-dependent methyltransferase [Deltaproteobacteria bacterium]
MITSYLMENPEEAIRLEIKTDPGEVKEQAYWCGLKPGMRVLDAGCGPGMVTFILNEFIQPGGEIVGVDYSEDRINYAKEHYAREAEIDYRLHDLRFPLKELGLFDLIWVRFVLEYNLAECREIIRNLSDCLKPGGYLCLLDLDYNCLTHYELPAKMQEILFKIMEKLEREHNFDPYAGRKLYSHLYDMGYQDIRMDLRAHHLFYGEIRDADIFNWLKKIEVASIKAKELFENYPGGSKGFFDNFNSFFKDPRRFTYTPLVTCMGSKPSVKSS